LRFGIGLLMSKSLAALPTKSPHDRWKAARKAGCSALHEEIRALSEALVKMKA
jgi:hypothetical protein